MKKIKREFKKLAGIFEKKGGSQEACIACWLAINRIDHDRDLVDPRERLTAIAQTISRLAWLAEYNFDDRRLPREGDYA